tara:strand:- start:840 stop:992 length:153 start_codon:yes stop_codon:yes gene_type:complete
MPDPDALWKDMSRLDALYQELCWDADDKLQFTIEGDHVIIFNETQRQQKP